MLQIQRFFSTFATGGTGLTVFFNVAHAQRSSVISSVPLYLVACRILRADSFPPMFVISPEFQDKFHADLDSCHKSGLYGFKIMRTEFTPEFLLE